jgi:hypothetical protein
LFGFFNDGLNVIAVIDRQYAPQRVGAEVLDESSRDLVAVRKQ